MRSLQICHTSAFMLLFGLACLADEKPVEPVRHRQDPGMSFVRIMEFEAWGREIAEEKQT